MYVRVDYFFHTYFLVPTHVCGYAHSSVSSLYADRRECVYIEGVRGYVHGESVYIFREFVDMYIERVCIFRESVDIYYIFWESVHIERACLYFESVYIWRESVDIEKVCMYGWRLSVSHTQTRTHTLAQNAECVHMESVYILTVCLFMEGMPICFIS